jgi:YegS/Rv2252/BmrU family lipid kinase
MIERVLIIANPTAGAGAGRINKPRLVDVARRDIERERNGKATLQVEVAFETTRESVVQRAAQAGNDGFQIVVAAGGDGTVNAVASGLMQARVAKANKKTPMMGVLPMGTGNVFAFNLGIERGLRAACRVVRHGHVRTIDVGTARALSPDGKEETRYFLLMAGIGFDAKVVEDTSLRLKYVLRDFAYVVKILQNGVTHRGTRITLKFAEGFEYSNRSWLVMVGNAASYAWDIRFTSRAHLDDGLVDVCLFPFQNKVASVRQVLQVLTGQHIERGQVEYWKTAGVTIGTDEPVPVQLDGDEWTHTPIQIGVLPGALQVLAPVDDVQASQTPLP